MRSHELVFCLLLCFLLYILLFITKKEKKLTWGTKVVDKVSKSRTLVLYLLVVLGLGL